MTPSTPQNPTHKPPAPPKPSPDRFHLLVDCRTEQSQRRLFTLLKSQGYPCRVLTL